MSRTETVSVLFCDLVGSTEHLGRMGDDLADEYLATFFGASLDVVGSRRGKVVKTLGDGVMAVFERSALDALLVAAELHEVVSGIGDDPMQLRIGVSTGEATEKDGDWFGTPVIEAARLCGAAPAGGTWTTAVVRSIVGSRGALGFVDRGPHLLKGLADRVAVFEVVHADAARPDGAPVDEPDVPRRHHRARRRVLGAAGSILAATALIVGAVALFDDPAPASDPPALAFSGDLDYVPVHARRPCATAAIAGQHCGTLSVPERRDDPGGQKVEVEVDEFDALEAGDRVAVMLGDVENPLSPVSRFGGRLLRIRPRGKAGSPFLACPEIVEAGTGSILRPLLAPDSAAAYLDAVSRCAARWEADGVDRSAYDLDDVALDVRDLVVAMDLEAVDLVVAAPHAAVALSILRSSPEILRTVTLVNPIPPTASSGDYVTAFSEAVDAFGALCSADPRCAAIVDDLVGAWETQYATLTAAPVTTSDVLDDGSVVSVALDGDRVASALSTAVGLRNLEPFVPRVLAARDLTSVGSNARDRSDVHDLAYGAELSDLCHRVAPLEQPVDAEVARHLPEYRNGVIRVPVLVEACRRWDVEPAGDGFRAPVASSVPALIVAGDLAASSLRTGVDDVAATFRTALAFRFPTLGYEPLDDGPQCLGDLRLRWLEDPEARPPAAEIDACEADSPPINWVG